MKKTELYRSIDTIKQDKELREQILKAVEEKDRVIVVKRPLFVPILVGCLLMFNIGVIAKLIIFNKSQVNMAELRARTSISSADSSFNDLDDEIEQMKKEMSEAEEERKAIEAEIAEQKKLHDEIEREKNMSQEELAEKAQMAVDFETQKANFLSEINSDPGESGKSYSIEEQWWSDSWSDPSRYTSSVFGNDGYIYIGDDDLDGQYIYCRYVETYDLTTKSVNGSALNYDFVSERGGEMITRFYTNHEYIVCYLNNLNTDNIVSITESNVNREDLTADYLNAEQKKLRTNEDKIKNTVKESGEKMLEEYFSDSNDSSYYRPYYKEKNLYCIFPENSMIGREKITAIQCIAGKKDYDDVSEIMNDYAYGLNYFVNTEGKDVSGEIFESSDYWKETLCGSVDAANRTIMPDVIGMDYEDAAAALEAVGLEPHKSFYHADEDSINKGIGFNQVIYTNIEPGMPVAVGEYISLDVCGYYVPYILGMPIDHAEELVEKLGYSVKIEYYDEFDREVAKSYPDDIIVYLTKPGYDEVVKPGGEVTLVAASPLTDSYARYIGRCFNMNSKKLCSAEEAQLLTEQGALSGTSSVTSEEKKPSELGLYGEIGRSDVLFYGRVYGDYFVVDEIKQTGYGYAIPYVGVSYTFPVGDVLDGLNGYGFVGENPYYEQHGAEVKKLTNNEYNYCLSFDGGNGKKLYAYLKTEVEKSENTYVECIKEIYVKGQE